MKLRNRKIAWMCINILFVGILNQVIAKDSDSLRLQKKQLQNCDDLYNTKKTEKALQCYLSVNQQYPNQYRSICKIAAIYYSLKQYQQCLLFINKAIAIAPVESFPYIIRIAENMHLQHDDQLALEVIERYQQVTLPPNLIQQLAFNKKQFSLVTQVYATEQINVRLRNMGDSINTIYNEYLPSVSLDGSRIVFTRNVGGNEDFFISSLQQNKWQKAANMGYPPNTSLPDGGAKLSADGYYLFYTRCDLRSPNGYEGGGCDIVFSYLEDSSWSAPQRLGATINTPAYEGQPCLSSDNKDLYFVSDRPGGFGGKDIWVSHFINNYWSEPENVGPQINTTKDESSPFIHPDNQTLYFASNGHPGLGDVDLYVSRRNHDGSWKKVMNLGSPINTPNFDGSIVVDAKGKLGYLASDRKDTKGGLDIYEFELYDAIKPVPTVCLKGYVIDKFTGEKIKNADIRVYNQFNREKIVDINSNRGDASFAIALQTGKQYIWEIKKGSYRTFYKTLPYKTDTLQNNQYYTARLRTPLLSDTLYTQHFVFDSTFTHLTATSKLICDTIIQRWKQWNEDSAVVKIYLKGYYYSGDSLLDSTFHKQVENCQNQLSILQDLFNKRGIDCVYLMFDMNMLVLKDDEEIFRTVDVTIIEDY